MFAIAAPAPRPFALFDHTLFMLTLLPRAAAVPSRRALVTRFLLKMRNESRAPPGRALCLSSSFRSQQHLHEDLFFFFVVFMNLSELQDLNWNTHKKTTEEEKVEEALFFLLQRSRPSRGAPHCLCLSRVAQGPAYMFKHD